MTLTTTLAGVVTGVLVTGGTALGFVADDDPVQPDGLRIPCGAIRDRLPEELRADLRGLAELPADQRPAAAHELRANALSGEYGERVRLVVRHRSELRRHLRERLPAELRRDLADARSLPVGDRPAAYREIRATALAGGYGDRVAEAAGRFQERRETCSGSATP